MMDDAAVSLMSIHRGSSNYRSKKMRSRYKSTVLFLIATCSLIFTYFFLYTVTEIKKSSVSTSGLLDQPQLSATGNSSDYPDFDDSGPIYDRFPLFDTCPLKRLNHLDSELLRFHHPEYNPKANCTFYESLTKLVRGQVYMKNLSQNYECQARCLFTEKDHDYIAGKWIRLPSSQEFPCDIVESSCTKDNKTIATMHTQIYEQKQVELLSLPDVYLIVIDSVSTFMAKRSLPKTIGYLKSIGAVQMDFLNKVGDNSRPNGFAFAFGKSIEGGIRTMVGLPPLIPDWNNTKICQEYLDQYSYYLWEYAKSGYKTMVANDFDAGYVYFVYCLGFNKTEADHMWRAVDIRIGQSNDFIENFNNSCSERHLEMLDYLAKFMNSYRGTPKIAQLWLSNLAHNSLGHLYHADDHFLEFIRRNREVIDRSFFFFLADHGPRYDGIGETHLGRYENKNPFLIVSIPSEYRQSPIHYQLRDKANQLMTHFDIHATLMDILLLQPKTQFTDTFSRDLLPVSRGSSLLREWQGARNCRNLPIPSAYCICQYKSSTVTDRKLINDLGRFFAEQLNQFLSDNGLGDKCRKQKYDKALSVRCIHDRHIKIYDVNVYLSPSGGLFSAYILLDRYGLRLGSGFSRMNLYGSQANCVFEHPLRPLCLCRNYTPLE